MEEHVNSTTCSTERKDSNSRKNKKPYIERKRRARINNCLDQLKTLVLQSRNKDKSQFSKLEKADILEMTVQHLRELVIQQQQQQQQQQQAPVDLTLLSKYSAGFSECAREVCRYVHSLPDVDDVERDVLLNHLEGCFQDKNQQQHQYLTDPSSLQAVPPQQAFPAGGLALFHPPPSLFQTGLILGGPYAAPLSAHDKNLVASFALMMPPSAPCIQQHIMATEATPPPAKVPRMSGTCVRACSVEDVEMTDYSAESSPSSSSSSSSQRPFSAHARSRSARFQARGASGSGLGSQRRRDAVSGAETTPGSAKTRAAGPAFPAEYFWQMPRMHVNSVESASSPAANVPCPMACDQPWRPW